MLFACLEAFPVDGEPMQTSNIVVYSEQDLVFVGHGTVNQNHGHGRLLRVAPDKPAAERTDFHEADSIPEDLYKGTLIDIYV